MRVSKFWRNALLRLIFNCIAYIFFIVKQHQEKYFYWIWNFGTSMLVFYVICSKFFLYYVMTSSLPETWTLSFISEKRDETFTKTYDLNRNHIDVVSIYIIFATITTNCFPKVAVPVSAFKTSNQVLFSPLTCDFVCLMHLKLELGNTWKIGKQLKFKLSINQFNT